MRMLELFQTTVREYMRFSTQLPIDFSRELSLTGEASDSTYVAANTRLMLLRKYTRNGRGSLYLSDIITEAIGRYPAHSEYLAEFQERFYKSCDQSLKHTLANGTERTLDESIDDIMYGLYLHADEERIYRITQDSELLRIYCVLAFVKEIEALVIELYDFFTENGVHCIETVHHLRAPVIHLEAHDAGVERVTASPYWGNLIGHDMNFENDAETLSQIFAQQTPEENQIWINARRFLDLLSQDPFSYNEIMSLVYEPNINDWGDFSKAISKYKAVSSPAISTTVRYNEQRDAAYVYIYPQVVDAFFIDTPQIVTDAYAVTLIKDQSLGEWRVFAFGGRMDPFTRD